ncbi:MAG: DUF3225 domain-containing protein [Verrucomicrobia bacterium]|nr:DUF3225 domain-containing protein [Verrucomicrobiota bacterium]
MLPWILAFSLSAAPLEESDPGTAAPSAVSPNYSADVQLITQQIAKQYQSWIARDIDGYMAAFWKSPLLVYVIDSDVAIGWDNAYGMVRRDFPAGQDAGHPVLERLQVNVIGPDAAVSVEWWTVHFRGADVHGNTSSAWRKFSEGWRTIECHTSSSEFPK